MEEFGMLYYTLGAFVWTFAAIFAAYIWRLPED
jgi:hypothetical protein